ncbi:MarR family winged helix-turn-helix transcriptional regulator [Leuconostoc sp. LN180020]|uniref:MarR family winged helix-turn-helix transcriptional regulator n=1 Tax=Leuconostoc sp. LN180020 TaxID=2571156 RepID=UPI0017800BC5|nr:MarR family transcriptional regulator [Leuconostoc sp. LN180020]QOG09872.1 MarR family transcriptional regulator [Leuconostoc sp. LN180020]
MTESIGKLLKIAHTSLMRDLDAIAQPHGLTAVQMTIIDYLSNASRVTTQHDVEQEFNIQGSTVTVMLDRMANKNLITRQKSTKDKRINEIHLTTRGFEVSDIIKGYIAEHDSRMLAPFTDAEQTVILQFLKMVGQSVTQKEK